MNNKILKIAVFTLVSFMQINDSGAAVNIQKSSLKTKTGIKISLDLESQLNENIDEHVNANGAGENIILNKLKLEAKITKKLSGNSKITSSTKINMWSGNFGAQYESESFINADDIDESLRQLRLNQQLNYNLKLSKKLTLSGFASLALNRGHKIEQELLEEQNRYHLLDNSYKSYSYGGGAKLKLIRGHITQVLYKYTEFDYAQAYTYDEEQGTDSRRQHSLGVLHKFRSSAKTIYKFSAQVNQVFYKDKLALNEKGFFQTTGLIKSTKLIDKNFKVSMKLKEGFEIGLLENNRVDLIDNGDGQRESGGEVKFSKTFSLITTKVSAKLSNKKYRGQLSDDGNSKRIDKIKIFKIAMVYQTKNQVKLKLNIQSIQQNSNQELGEFGNQVFGAGINKTF